MGPDHFVDTTVIVKKTIFLKEDFIFIYILVFKNSLKILTRIIFEHSACFAFFLPLCFAS